jgi:hypothetical protein
MDSSKYILQIKSCCNNFNRPHIVPKNVCFKYIMLNDIIVSHFSHCFNKHFIVHQRLGVGRLSNTAFLKAKVYLLNRAVLKTRARLAREFGVSASFSYCCSCVGGGESGTARPC